MTDLTRRQTDWLDFIRQFIDDRGFAPTRREFADHFGVSPNGAQHAILTLERKGWLRRAPGTARGVKPPPMLNPGCFAAGAPNGRRVPPDPPKIPLDPPKILN